MIRLPKLMKPKKKKGGIIMLSKIIYGAILGYALTECVIKPAIVVGLYLQGQANTNTAE